MLLLAAASCGSPHYAAATIPDDAQLYVDGRRSPTSAVDEEIPYHGTMIVRAAPPAPTDPTPENQYDPTLGSTERRIEMPAPVSRAIFPIDFVIGRTDAIFARGEHDEGQTEIFACSRIRLIAGLHGNLHRKPLAALLIRPGRLIHPADDVALSPLTQQPTASAVNPRTGVIGIPVSQPDK